jgi:histidine triad (HIT) family protein
MMPDCLFCKIVAGEIPSTRLYEDEVCLAFYDIDPQAPTHFLVIPKTHIQSVSEINLSNSALVGHNFQVIAKLTRELGLESYRVVSNIGAQAGQSVPHLHMHVLAGRDMSWPPG